MNQSPDTNQHQTDGDTSAQECARVIVWKLPDERESAVNALRRVLDLNITDARIRVNHLPGIYPEVLRPEVAAATAEAIVACGGHAIAIDEADLPCLDHARTLHHARCRPEGFEIVGISGQAEELIPWSSLSLMSIGFLPLETIRRSTDVGAGSLHPSPFSPTDVVESHSWGSEMWLTSESPFRVFHIEHEAFNYEYLGDRKSTSGTANFTELVKDILSFAPNLFLTRSARAFVEHDSADSYRFESQAAHRMYVVSQLVLMRRVRSEVPPEAATGSAAGEKPHDHAKSSAELTTHQRSHVNLQGRIHELRHWWHDACEMGEPRFGELKRRVEELRETVAKHFAFEEEGGYMTVVLERAPRFSSQVETLHHEHGTVLAGLDKLIETLQQSEEMRQSSAKPCADLEQMLCTLERHEHAENAIVQATFDDDISAGD